MKSINSLSGGKTSSYMAVHYPADYNLFSLVCIDDIKCKPKDKSVIDYVNKKFDSVGLLNIYGEFIATAEDDITLKTMIDLEQKLGSEIIWVRSNSFEHWIDKKKMLPNMTMRYCTTEMKIIPIAEYVIKNMNYPVIMNQGIRYDEMERMKIGDAKKYKNKIIIGKNHNSTNKWKEYYWAEAAYPLVENKVLHYRIQKYWENNEITFPKDSNCVGCFWKDVQQLRKNWDDNTDKMQWFSNQEIRRKHFFKPGINYSQIKNIEIQSEFDFGTGSGCQAGFCTD